ncbi:MAG: hypothetical protein IJH09_02930 [Clostridia bacterium]|nr:hypothetical protein [Clostridia bacterium]
MLFPVLFPCSFHLSTGAVFRGNARSKHSGFFHAHRQAAPGFAYIIGEYTLDRNGVLIGPRNSRLMLTLDQDGYRTK